MSTEAITAYQPGLKSLGTMAVSEAKMVIRDAGGLVIPVLAPMVILVMTAGQVSAESGSSGLSGLETYVLPLVFGIALAAIGVINMPSFLAYYRKTGVLRRLAVTPASPAMVLVSQVLVSTIQAIIGVGAALTLGVVVFNASLPPNALVMAGVWLLALGSMYGVGMIVSAFSPSPNSAVAIGLMTFFFLGAMGGMFGGMDAIPDVIAPAAQYLPFGAAMEATAAVWAGESPDLTNILAMAGWTVIGGIVAARFFRWE